MKGFVLGCLGGLAIGGGIVVLGALLDPAPECFVLQEPVRFDSPSLLEPGSQIVLSGTTEGHIRVVLEGVAMERCTGVPEGRITLRPAGRP